MANIPTDQLNQARILLKDAQSVLILIGNEPKIDSIASGLSLYLALTASGKQATIVCPSPMTVEYSSLVGVDVISNSINAQNGRNLVISFPYQEGSIEKVSYNIENETFNLVIEPRDEYPIVTSEMMRYSYNGGNIDLIFTVGVSQLTQLNELYSVNQSLFSQKPVINVDTQTQNSRYGKVNIIDSTVTSISELLVTLFSNLGLSMEPDISSNLLAGITSGSQSFSSSLTNANTFEAAAICLRNGANKSQTEQKRPTQISQTSFSRMPTQPINSMPTFKPQKPNFSKPQMGISSSIPSQIMENKIQNKKPSLMNSYQPSSTDSTPPETPPDWLKPKIYKGSTLL